MLSDQFTFAFFKAGEFFKHGFSMAMCSDGIHDTGDACFDCGQFFVDGSFLQVVFSVFRRFAFCIFILDVSYIFCVAKVCDQFIENYFLECILWDQGALHPRFNFMFEQP